MRRASGSAVGGAGRPVGCRAGGAGCRGSAGRRRRAAARRSRCSSGGCSGRRTGTAGAAGAGRGTALRVGRLCAADRHVQRVAGDGAVVIGRHRVDLEVLVQHGGIHFHLYSCLAGCLRHFHAVGVPADGTDVQIFAAQLGTEGVGVAQNGLAVAADLDGSLCKHGFQTI